MRKTYRVLADIIAVLVVVQAAMMVWAIAGLFSWIDDGATLDKAVIEGWENEPPTFEGSIGHFIHLMSGTFLIPLIGLLLLLVSFFAKVPRGVTLAATVVVLIVIQYLAGFFAEPDMPLLGLCTERTPSSCSGRRWWPPRRPNRRRRRRRHQSRRCRKAA